MRETPRSSFFLTSDRDSDYDAAETVSSTIEQAMQPAAPHG